MDWLNFTQSFVKFKETSPTSPLRKGFAEPACPWPQAVSTIMTLKQQIFLCRDSHPHPRRQKIAFMTFLWFI